MYIQYRQGFFHSKLFSADYALVTSSLHYKDSLGTWTVIHMTAAKFKPLIRISCVGLRLVQCNEQNSKSKSKSHYDRHMSRPVRLGVRRPVRVRVWVTLQLMVSQSASLGVEPNLWLLTRDNFFFFKVTVLSFGGALSDERSGLSSVSPLSIKSVVVVLRVRVRVTLRITISQHVLVSSPILDNWPEFAFSLKFHLDS
jgi:hypothetical protein